jgi:hypothetical protein
MHPRITYANVMSTLAVVLALGGTAVAATKITTGQIKDAAVTTAKVHDGAITARKLAAGAITPQGDARYARSISGSAALPMQTSQVATIVQFAGARLAIAWIQPPMMGMPTCQLVLTSDSSTILGALTNMASGATVQAGAYPGMIPIASLAAVDGTYLVNLTTPGPSPTYATAMITFTQGACSATWRGFR